MILPVQGATVTVSGHEFRTYIWDVHTWWLAQLVKRGISNARGMVGRIWSLTDFRSNTDEVGNRTNAVHQLLSTNLVP